MTRTRSHWGWGFTDRFPSDEARLRLARRVHAVLGGAPALRPLPSIEAAALPPPSLAIPAELSAFATDAREARLRATWGRAFPDLVRGFSGDFSGAPDLVLTPHDEAQIEAALAWATREGVALVPRGGGTSVVGGVERDPGATRSVVLSLERLDRVLRHDPLSQLALVQAGATGPRIEAQLRAHGLTLRCFPQSFELATLGGWIATRAGGHYATLHTHVDDLVQAVRMVTPRGVWQSLPVPASGAGPSPNALVLGSEGTLGVITEAWMRVTERPKHRASAAVHVADFQAATQLAREIVQARLWPSNCRVLDPGEAMLHEVAADGSAVLLLGFEHASLPQGARLQEALSIALRHGATCPRGPVERHDDLGSPTDDAAGSWKQAFLDAPYLQSALVSIGVLADTFESCCTWAAWPQLQARVEAAVNAALLEACGGGVLTCRFTHVYPDGPAPYWTFLGLARPGEELSQWRRVKGAALAALREGGATVTHHHAVGRTHAAGYAQEAPGPMLLGLRAMKDALDPAGILNPGVLLPRCR